MNVLELLKAKGIEPKKAATTKGGEWWSACPGCGGRDRFHVWPEQNNGDGSYWCRQCDKKGGAIQFLIDFDGMDFKAACAALGKDLPSSGFRTPQRHTEKRKSEWQPREFPPPSELWRNKAGKFIDRCHQVLIQQPRQVEWLAARGILLEAIKEFKLGWNPSDHFRPREAWGLETIIKENGKNKKLWIPRGIVIPCLFLGHASGFDIPVRIRIRRPKVDLKKESDSKYFIVPGSGMETMLLRPETRAFVVIEAELDAIAIKAACPDGIGIVCTGSASTRPDAASVAVLKKAVTILVALDFDKAGAKEWHWWQQQFPQAMRWPVPEGKDPGDAVKAGVDLYAWVYAGLPPAMTIGHSFLDSGKEGVAGLKPGGCSESKAAPAPESKCTLCGWAGGKHFELCPNGEKKDG